jgi:hypothetical protein
MQLKQEVFFSSFELRQLVAALEGEMSLHSNAP